MKVIVLATRDTKSIWNIIYDILNIDKTNKQSAIGSNYNKDNII